MRRQVQAAKERFGELGERAQVQDPQVLTGTEGRGGRHVVEEYARLAGDDASLLEFIRSTPDFDLLDLERSAPRTSRRSRPVVITAAAS